MEPGASPLAQLSEEELCIICRFLGPKDVARLGAASKDLAAAVFCDEIWHGLLQRAGGPPSREPRRAARAVTTLGSAVWQRLGPGCRGPGDLGAPGPREQFAAFLCHRGATLVVFGGRTALGYTSECWALDLETGEWTFAVGLMPTPSGPAARVFGAGADGGGGGVLRSSSGHEWLVLHGGLRAEGFRDNETWVLGPLGAAATADKWRWAELQPDGRPQSEQRPQPRFHHTLSVVRNQLVIVGGHDHTLTPILSPYALSVATLSVEADASGLPRIVGAAEARWRPLADAPRDTVYETGPVARAHHSAAVTKHGSLVIFGGVSLSQQRLPQPCSFNAVS